MRDLPRIVAVFFLLATPLRCNAVGGGAGGSTSTPSGNAPPTVTCWLSASRCDCRPNTTAPEGATIVANCTTQQYAYCCQYGHRCGCDDNPGCGTGGREVSACENRYENLSSTCPRDGYVSCSDSSTCPCGLICARVASSSTERFCTESCSSDSDCSNSSRWNFSSVGCNPRTGVCVP